MQPSNVWRHHVLRHRDSGGDQVSEQHAAEVCFRHAVSKHRSRVGPDEPSYLIILVVHHHLSQLPDAISARAQTYMCVRVDETQADQLRSTDHQFSFVDTT